MSMKSVAILGLGAVGSYVFWGLSNKRGIDLSVVADGERKERLEKEGIIINDEKYAVKVKTPEEARGVDLLIVCLKYNGLRPALSDIQTIASENTVVMSLMNGVDSEEIISEVIPETQIVYSMIKVASERIGNTIRFNPEATIGIFFGEKDGNNRKRIDSIGELFANTGINYHATEEIVMEIWSKYRLNVADNQPQAIVGCGVGAYRDSEHMAFIRKKLQEEVEAVAKAKGVILPPAGPFRIGKIVRPRARYSTLQDIDAKRHTEVDMFSGAMIRMGAELGIPTPFNEMTYHLIKSLEEKNDGLFDYEA